MFLVLNPGTCFILDTPFLSFYDNWNLDLDAHCCHSTPNHKQRMGLLQKHSLSACLISASLAGVLLRQQKFGFQVCAANEDFSLQVCFACSNLVYSLHFRSTYCQSIALFLFCKMIYSHKNVFLLRLQGRIIGKMCSLAESYADPQSVQLPEVLLTFKDLVVSSLLAAQNRPMLNKTSNVVNMQQKMYAPHGILYCMTHYFIYASRVVLSYFLYWKPHLNTGEFLLSLNPGVSNEIIDQCTTHTLLTGGVPGPDVDSHETSPFLQMEDPFPKLHQCSSLRLNRCQGSEPLSIFKIAFCKDI